MNKIEKKELRELTCPICGKEMRVRIKCNAHINKSAKALKKHKYYQYYCEACDNEETGWTSEQSDNLSLKIKL